MITDYIYLQVFLKRHTADIFVLGIASVSFPTLLSKEFKIWSEFANLILVK